jgi:hypothetical protein
MRIQFNPGAVDWFFSVTFSLDSLARAVRMEA